ncbi:12297_t:CDS:2 [Dentiscutata heterogama]|uniref:12297_t:CDS:1 n=1 Tax=Dentiscutata heterogama TaxID=1316150 RepID=A0ACA9KHU1_9GLOM|nr:12297_t:CDS:2 [Dentiscutata heterogama]
MKDKIHEELTNFLSVILEELLLEKNQKTNAIDDLLNSQSQMGSMKKCTFCQASDINNRKQVCPNCHNKLPTISEMNQQSNELSTIKNITDKSLIVPRSLKATRYSESDTQEPRTRPSFTTKSSRYRAQIRKTQFVNLKSNNHNFQNISGEWKISEEIKRFSEIACMKRIEFIKAKLINKTALDIWYPMPITCEEADH